MESFISCLLASLAGLIAIPVTVFLLECLAAVALRKRKPYNCSSRNPRPHLAVVVPAHNESMGVCSTIDDVKSQLDAGDRVLVVADNCTDDTAFHAARAGAEVVERHDTDRIGKGYALDFALDHLSKDPPDVVVVIDADCSLADDAIDRLASTCVTFRRPVQALYLMTAPENPPINYQVAEFAWRVKNWVRPLGLSVLDVPCQLMGSGMAFPWDIIRSAELASGMIVEDMKLGLDLALAGTPALFCPSAVVKSQFPPTAKGAETQRQRWEQGHIWMILLVAPRLIFVAIARGDLRLLALALDIAVPPLSLLGILVVGLAAASCLAVLLGLSSAALIISTASLLGYATAVVVCWLKCGRDVLPAGAIFSVASYVAGKLSLYGRVLTGRAVPQWIRTDREKSEWTTPRDAPPR